MPTTDPLTLLMQSAAKKRSLRTRPYGSEMKEEDMPVLTAKEGFTFGCDPELFVFDQNGKPVPAEMIPGSKAEPHKVEGGAVQRDGFAAEFNIDPVTTFADFNRNIEKVMKQLEGFLPEGYTLQAIPSVVFDEDVFDKASDDTKELGCQPDYDAWTGSLNPPPANPDNPFMRCAGGHLHVGWTEGADVTDVQHVMNCTDLVKQFDWYLGGWALAVDTDNTRRQLYGKAGACRIKDYGVEYRTLSNFWVTTRDRRLMVWNRMQEAISKMSTNFIPDRCPRGYNDLLVKSINTSTRDRMLEGQFRFPLRTLDWSYARW